MTEQADRTRDAVLTWLKARTKPGAHLCIDSRNIRPGDVFVALKGEHTDGLSWAPVAVARGAAAVLTEEREGEKRPVLQVPVLAVRELKKRLGEIASDFFGRPSEHMMGTAVTGTNGKTSISHWTARLLSALHHPCAAVGTMGCFYMGEKIPSPALTTPDAASTQDLFSNLYGRGCQAFCIEASSIGLVQGRLDGTAFHTAAFTNLTRDHLDYHGSMQAYEEAKALLFDWPGLKCAVINADDAAGRRLIEKTLVRGVRTIACTLDAALQIEGCEMLAAGNIRAAHAGTAFDALWRGERFEIEAAVLGRFNVSNLLETAGIVLSLGIPARAVFGKLTELTPPAGRLQTVTSEGAPLAVVDYAHTPDALEKVLTALRETAEHRGGRLWCVFGAGGDRDPGKRPIMGRVAAELADVAVVTSDNPRTEEPAVIAQAVAEGAAPARDRRVVLDRREAIVSAVTEAAAADVVLIAGKGHEDYQEIQGVKHHFSDVEVVREAFNERRTRVGGKSA